MGNLITRKNLVDLLLQEWDNTVIKDIKKFYMNLDDMKFIKECNKQHINLQIIRKNTYYLI